MSAPARAGIFIYAKDPDRLSGFYQSVLGMTAVHRTDQMVVLRSPDLQLIVHAMPPQVASHVVITSPPQLRDSAAIKFFCTVPSLSTAQESAQSLGRSFLSNGRGRGSWFAMPATQRAISSRFARVRPNNSFKPKPLRGSA